MGSMWVGMGLKLEWEVCGLGWGELEWVGNGIRKNQGVGSRREIQLTRPALPYMILRALIRCYICIRNICQMCNYRVYNNLFSIFLIQM